MSSAGKQNLPYVAGNPPQSGGGDGARTTEGGAIRGIGEKFAANPFTGTGSFSIPIAVSPSQSGFSPQLTLSYDSRSGNSPFGWGFSMSLPEITRRTDKGLPRYCDSEESDSFILSGSEDLVPTMDGAHRRRETRTLPNGKRYLIGRYRPRIEGLFSRIERWTDSDTGICHWRSISKDNVTTFYGHTAAARIADPHDPTRVFTWLIEESHDDKGNVIAYEYKPEDPAGVSRWAQEERHRLLPRAGFANRYIKRIKYGNRIPYHPEGSLFELVFDYGEHDALAPRLAEDHPWPVRSDPFSSYRAGFEVRTYRLCSRVLMFHISPEELGSKPCLVRSTDLDHGHGSPIASCVRKLTERSYVRNADGKSYLSRSLPSVEMTYSEAYIDDTLRDLDPASLENLSTSIQQILDLCKDGHNYRVPLRQPRVGCHRQEDDGSFGPFRAFPEAPSVDWNDPSLKMVDLTGDGRANILISEEDVFTWYQSRGTLDCLPAERTPTAYDEERSPRLIFADGTDSIYLADMSGDGLSDLVRIRNGEVCYWPSLGYGRFGAKVTMDGAPFFDTPDLFSQRRIRLADVDGCGTTDIIYLEHERVCIYFNQSGNSLGQAYVLESLPPIDDSVSVTAVDLWGNGTDCLVLSSPLPNDSRQPVRYVDLMGGQKPHLLTQVVNSLGAKTHIRYAPSTRFYLADLRAGLPWNPKLPFRVQCVERVETYDAIGRNRFFTRYAYHHGHYDGIEKEFCGFGMVEQWDKNEYATLRTGDALPPGENDRDAASNVPAVRTRTWFHTGVYLEGKAVLPPNLTIDEEREACRSLKGSILRQEVYDEDGSAKASIPYSVSESAYTIVPLQRRGENRYAVFFTYPRESIGYHYERSPDDPRVGHDLVLEVDDFGNILRSASIGYGRRPEMSQALEPRDRQKLTQLLSTSSENASTIFIDDADSDRAASEDAGTCCDTPSRHIT
jgi:hypothetical protein